MAVSTPTLRARVAAAIDTALGASDWRESRHAFDVFPRDTRNIAHKSYAVGVPTSTPDPQEVRQLTSVGAVHTSTSLVVRWAYRIRADAQVSDYDAALTDELAALAAVMGTARTDGLSVRWLGSTRTHLAEGTLLFGEMSFTAFHTFALS